MVTLHMENDMVTRFGEVLRCPGYATRSPGNMRLHDLCAVAIGCRCSQCFAHLERRRRANIPAQPEGLGIYAFLYIPRSEGPAHRLTRGCYRLSLFRHPCGSRGPVTMHRAFSSTPLDSCFRRNDDRTRVCCNRILRAFGPGWYVLAPLALQRCVQP